MKRGRFLIATPGFTGHATPELTLARRLVRRGHDVSVYAPAELERQVAAAGAVHLPFAAFQLRRPSEAVPLAEQIRQGARHFESPALAEELVDLLQRERVAVAVVDYLLAAAFTAAEAARVPTACVLPVLYTPWALWYGQHMYDDGAARAALGLHRSSGEAATALASWAKLVLVFSTRRFDFPIRGRRDRRVEYVGRMIDPELPRWDSPWPPDDRRPLVLVSPSSLYRRQRPAQLQ
jgi:UDP:flavonoid glycosyltransferase YjiC (YdhE family)